jgi:cell division septal protein FtsQ
MDTRINIMNHHQNFNVIVSTEQCILYLKKLKTITKQVKQPQNDYKINLKRTYYPNSTLSCILGSCDISIFSINIDISKISIFDI